MFTSAFMHHNMFGFIPYAEKMLREGLSFNEAIEQIIENIKEKPEWYASVVKQAEERGISVEDNLRSNAEYVYYSFLGAKQKLNETQP